MFVESVPIAMLLYVEKSESDSDMANDSVACMTQVPNCADPRQNLEYLHTPGVSSQLLDDSACRPPRHRLQSLPLFTSPDMSVLVSKQFLNGAEFSNGHTYTESDSIPHTMEKNLPGGGNWVVQKFGGTSVGKFAVNIADIVKTTAQERRVAIVCSARSSSTKADGTTTRLLRAAREAESNNTEKYQEIVQTIQEDHIQTAKETIQSHDILLRLEDDIVSECQKLTAILHSAQTLGEVSIRTEDLVIGKGEKLSCMYMAALLNDIGVPAQYVDLSSSIQPEANTEIDEHFYTHLNRTFANEVHACGEKVPVITGYFGNVPGGLIKSIGRGYTDLCAALVAVGLRAAELQVWKEVDGIFTADPRKVPTARLLPSVSPSEAAELTFYGSEVIHPFTMEQVIRARIPIRIKNVMNPRNNGTLIVPEVEETTVTKVPLFRTRSSLNLSSANTPKRPTAVTIKRNIVVLNVHSNKRTRAHGFLMNIFSILDRWHLSVDLISSSEVHVSMALHSESTMLSGGGDDELKIQDQNLDGAIKELRRFGSIDLVANMAIVSLVGKQLKNMVGISGKFFCVLGENNINIEMISQG